MMKKYQAILSASKWQALSEGPYTYSNVKSSPADQCGHKKPITYWPEGRSLSFRRRRIKIGLCLIQLLTDSITHAIDFI